MSAQEREDLTDLRGTAERLAGQTTGLKGDRLTIERAIAGDHFTPEVVLALLDRVAELEAKHRDLTSRIGFGDNITEPMADNDTIVNWFDEQSRDANEWQESQLWRNDCYEKGHPDDEDCFECDPSLRLEAAEAVVARVEALAVTLGWFAESSVSVTDREVYAIAHDGIREALAGESE